MAGSLPPGIGNPQQAMQATAFIRSEPWYLQWIASLGKRPDANGNVKLSDSERDQLRDMAVAHGIGLNNKFDGIDENGQIVEEHHKLRNGLIAAGIGAAALSGFGAAGIGPLSGMFGAGAASIPATEGIASATSLGLPVTAGLGTAGTAAAAAGGAGAALSTGSKLASLASGLSKFGSALDPANGPGASSTRGSAYAAQANQLANNRAAQAKIDQAGPGADAQAFKNQMRAALVARMDPNAAPISLNGTALPQLVTPEGVASAAKLRDTLAARVAAGKTPTTFGIADPTQEELDAQAKAADAAGVGSGLNSKLADVGDYLQTGSRLANLGKNAWDFGSNIVKMF
jgi:hypothetical protein